MFRYLIHCIVTKHLLFSFIEVKLTGFKFFSLSRSFRHLCFRTLLNCDKFYHLQACQIELLLLLQYYVLLSPLRNWLVCVCGDNYALRWLEIIFMLLSS